jgi:hypothetical protein
MAVASASEVRYLIGLSSRLGYMPPAAAADLQADYSSLIRGLQRLLTSLRATPSRGLRPEA